MEEVFLGQLLVIRDRSNSSRNIFNNLGEKIINFEIEYLYGGGYYEIERLIDTNEN